MSATKRGPSWPLSAIVMLVGLGLVVPFIVSIVTAVKDTAGSEIFEAPDEVTRELDEGRWVIFERTSTSSSGGFRLDGTSPDISPSDVTVTGPDGDEIETSFDRSHETVTRGSAEFTGVVVFDVEEPGTYEIEVDGDGQQVLVAPSLGQTFRSLGAPFVLAMLGGLLFFVGLVMLIVGMVRRSSAKKRSSSAAPATTAPAVAAGWYADPGGNGRRYWDGTAWTDHTAP